MQETKKYVPHTARPTIPPPLQVSATFEMREALTEFIELSQWLVGGLLGPRHAPSKSQPN